MKTVWWWASLLTASTVIGRAVQWLLLKHSPDWVKDLDAFLVGLATWCAWDAFVPRKKTTEDQP